METKTIRICLCVCCLFLFLPVVSAYSYYNNLVDQEFMGYLGIPDEKTISMDFKDAKLTDVLKIFSQQSGMNFIADTKISDKSINLYLEKVPVDQALERILAANDLRYEVLQGSKIFIVKEIQRPEIEVVTKVYQLRHAVVPGSRIRKTFTVSKKDEDDGDDDEDDEDEDIGILAAVESILTSNGSVIEDPRTNSLIVKDIATNFVSIDATIARLDIPNPQVLIEAEILDVARNDVDDLGFKWGATPMYLVGGAKDTRFPFVRSVKEAEDLSYTTGELSFAPNGTTSTGLATVLHYLRTRTNTKNLARPRIMTMSNESAEIKITADEAIGVQSTSSGEGAGTQNVAEAERVETGVSLKVTPQVNLLANEILMAIRPRVVDASATVTLNANQYKNPETRGTKSIFRMKDGDTIVIGGLLRTTGTLTKTSMPLLDKIPILGAAFRHKEDNQVERELVVFITPHIIRDEVQQLAADVYGRKNFENIVREQKNPNRDQSIEQALLQFEQAK